MRIDTLDASDLDAAMAVAAEWEYAREDLAWLLSLSDGCSTVAFDGDDAVGITLGFPWDPVGYIGSVRVLESARGHGLGQRLTEASVQALVDHGCPTVKLYATPKAIPVYERAGFVGEAEFTLAAGTHKRGRDPTVHPLADHLDEALALDRELFAGDRKALVEAQLKRDPELAVCVLDREGAVAGYAMARAYPEATEVGPIVVRDGNANVAQELVDALLVRVPEGDVEVLYPSRSWAAKSAWDCRGFVALEHPLQMRYGPPVDEHREGVVAVGGQELG